MKKYIALLRAINVGGNNLIKMVDLKLILAKLGLANVQTYIQSGNVVFETEQTSISQIGDSIGKAIKASHGFLPQILIISDDDLKTTFTELSLEYEKENNLYFWFLAQPAKQAKITEIETLLASEDTYKLTDKVFYMSCPNGIGKSKLPSKLERLLGVSATARNLRTVKKILEMIS